MNFMDVRTVYEGNIMMSRIDPYGHLEELLQDRFVDYGEDRYMGVAGLSNGLRLRIEPINNDGDGVASLYRASAYSSEFGHVEFDSMEVGPHNIDEFSKFLTNVSSPEKADEISSKFEQVEEMNSKVKQLYPSAFAKMSLEADEISVGESRTRVIFNNGYGIEILKGSAPDMDGAQTYTVETTYVRDNGIRTYIENMECTFRLGAKEDNAEDLERFEQEHHMSEYLVAISKLGRGELEFVDEYNCDLSKLSFLASHMASSADHVAYICDCMDTGHNHWELDLKWTPAADGADLSVIAKRGEDAVPVPVGEKHYTMETESLHAYFNSLREIMDDSRRLSRMPSFEIDGMAEAVGEGQNPIRDFLSRDVEQLFESNPALRDVLDELGYSRFDMSKVFEEFSSSEKVVSTVFAETEEGNRAGIFYLDNGNLLMIESLYARDDWYMQSEDNVYRVTAFREYNGETYALESRDFSFDYIMAVDGLPAFAKLVASEEYAEEFQERAQRIEQIHEDYSKINNIQELATIDGYVSFTNNGFVVDLGDIYVEISKSSNNVGIETYHINPFYRDELGTVFPIENLAHDFVLDSEISQIQMNQYLNVLGSPNVDFIFTDENNVEITNTAFTEEYLSSCINALASKDSSLNVFGEMLSDNSFGVEFSTSYEGEYVYLGSISQGFSCDSLDEFFDKSKGMLEDVVRAQSLDDDKVLSMAEEAMESPNTDVINSALHEDEADIGLEF